MTHPELHVATHSYNSLSFFSCCDSSTELLLLLLLLLFCDDRNSGGISNLDPSTLRIDSNLAVIFSTTTDGVRTFTLSIGNVEDDDIGRDDTNAEGEEEEEEEFTDTFEDPRAAAASTSPLRTICGFCCWGFKGWTTRFPFLTI